MTRPANPHPRRYRQPNGTKPATSEYAEKASDRKRDAANFDRVIATAPRQPPRKMARA